MNSSDLIDPDITLARTLPSHYYTSEECYRSQIEGPLASGWHFLTDLSDLEVEPGAARPEILLPGSLEEPLLVVRENATRIHLLSNVCPHRGNLVLQRPGCRRELRCEYHGRRFSLAGQMLSMPEFQGCKNFPSASDSLPEVPSGRWGDLLFASVEPRQSFQEFLAPITQRLAWLPFEQMRLDPKSCRDYSFQGHWALYNDNYLEGFHVPYVHPGLARVLDKNLYRTELLPRGTLQVGIARAGESCLEPPEGHRDRGQRIAGYYFWLFPSTMINIYPWGLSLNAIQPLGPGETRVHFRSYVWNPELQSQGAGGDLDTVEQEDEAVVESVQRGVRSRFYDRGRYSPSQERGVHHFHRLLLEELNQP